MQTFDQTDVVQSDVIIEQSPWRPANLLQLFTRPATFFSRTDLDLDGSLSLPLTGYLVGISAALTRIETTMLRSDTAGSNAVHDWSQLWLTLMGSGLFGWMFVWWIGGWWYRIRLGWSGAYQPDPRKARVVFFYVLLVEALPAVMVLLLHTLFYDSYFEAWHAGSFLDIIPLLFLGLSAYVSFNAATSAFAVERTKAVIWFIVVPLTMYLSILVLIGGFAYF